MKSLSDYINENLNNDLNSTNETTLNEEESNGLVQESEETETSYVAEVV